MGEYIGTTTTTTTTTPNKTSASIVVVVTDSGNGSGGGSAPSPFMTLETTNNDSCCDTSENMFHHRIAGTSSTTTTTSALLTDAISIMKNATTGTTTTMILNYGATPEKVIRDNDNDVAISTGIEKLSSSSPSPTTTTITTTAADAATFARLKRRRKVQLLRQKKKLPPFHNNSNDDDNDAVQHTNNNNNVLMEHSTTSSSNLDATVLSLQSQPQQWINNRPTITTAHPLMQSLIDQASSNSSNNTNEPPSRQIQPQHIPTSSTLTTTTTTTTCNCTNENEHKRSSFVTIIPNANGVQEICHRLHDRKECVAIPTECTYEMIHPFQYSTSASVVMSNNTQPSPQLPHHVYIPSVSIFDTCPFWKHVLPKKSYAIRKEPTSTTAIVSTFNESVHVLRRLSRKCWPGPILMCVQVPQPIDGLTITVPASTNSNRSIPDQRPYYYTNESNVQHYIAIRKPCHPLSRKVCSEYYKRQFRGTPAAGMGGSSNHSSCSSTPSASPMFMSLTSPETPQLSSIGSLRLSLQLPQLPPPPPFMLTPCRRVESSLSLATSTTSASLPGGPEDADGDATLSSSICDRNTEGNMELHGTTPESKNIPRGSTEYVPSPFLLVGTPMMRGGNSKKKRMTSHRNNSNSPMSATRTDRNDSEYVQSTEEAVAVLSQQSDDTVTSNHDNIVHAVLHGEERYEILSVPTCVYQKPYPTSIWIDSTNRIVRIKKTVTKHSGPTHSTVPTPTHPRQMSPQSIMTSSPSFLSLPQEATYMIDETSLLHSLRHAAVGGHSLLLSQPPPSSPTTLSPKERVLQAVLMKWKVVTDE